MGGIECDKRIAKYGHYLQTAYGDGYIIRKYNRPDDVSTIQKYKDTACYAISRCLTGA